MKTRNLIFGLSLALGCATAHAADLPDATKESGMETKAAKIKECDVSTAAELVGEGNFSMNKNKVNE